MDSKRLKIGDVFEIPLSTGQKAYGQYVYRDKMGPMIRVFDIRADDQATLEEVANSDLLFPPVITGLVAALRTGMWKVIGNLPVEKFVYPNFISPLYDDRTREVYRWSLWDGENYRPLGKKLPNKHRRLEQLVIWSPYDVVHRIETGENTLDFILDL